MLKVVHEENQSQQHALAGVGGSLLDVLARDGARQMLAAALLAEVAAYVEANAGEVDENGHRLVVRNGFHDPREVATAAGAVPVRAPRVNDKRIDEATGERKRFSSAILPAWARKSPGVAEVLPLLYLHGLSSGDFVPALEQFLGSTAGLSAATVTRLTAQWQDDAKAFGNRSLAETDYVYLWVDGIHAAVIGTGVLAEPALDLELGLPDEGNLTSDTTQRKAYDLLADGFGPGFNGPLTIVVDGEAASDVQGAANGAAEAISALDDVAAVTPAVLNPAGDTAIVTVFPESGPGARHPAGGRTSKRDRGPARHPAAAGPTADLACR